MNENKPIKEKKAPKLGAIFLETSMIVLILLIGGFGYGFLETLFRGYTHWSMMFTGAAALLTLYYLNKQFKNAPITIKAVIGAFVITIYELAVGLIVNTWFGFNVWDYADRSYNFLGLICPLFSFIWFILCFLLASIYYFFHIFNRKLQSHKIAKRPAS